MEKIKSKPKVLGITGEMGAGKTTVANLFKEKYGIPVFNADMQAKKLMETDILKPKIKALLGESSYQYGKLNRSYIAGIIFTNKGMLKKIENLVHPVVVNAFKEWLKNQNSPYVILENAILFKSGMDKLCDEILWVEAPMEKRIQRVIKRDKTERKQVLDRLKNQLSLPEVKEKIHRVIENTGKIEQLITVIDEIHARMLSKN